MPLPWVRTHAPPHIVWNATRPVLPPLVESVVPDATTAPAAVDAQATTAAVASTPDASATTSTALSVTSNTAGPQDNNTTVTTSTAAPFATVVSPSPAVRARAAADGIAAGGDSRATRDRAWAQHVTWWAGVVIHTALAVWLCLTVMELSHVVRGMRATLRAVDVDVSDVWARVTALEDTTQAAASTADKALELAHKAHDAASTSRHTATRRLHGGGGGDILTTASWSAAEDDGATTARSSASHTHRRRRHFLPSSSLSLSSASRRSGARRRARGAHAHAS